MKIHQFIKRIIRILNFSGLNGQITTKSLKRFASTISFKKVTKYINDKFPEMNIELLTSRSGRTGRIAWVVKAARKRANRAPRNSPT